MGVVCLTSDTSGQKQTEHRCEVDNKSQTGNIKQNREQRKSGFILRLIAEFKRNREENIQERQREKLKLLWRDKTSLGSLYTLDSPSYHRYVWESGKSGPNQEISLRNQQEIKN